MASNRRAGFVSVWGRQGKNMPVKLFDGRFDVRPPGSISTSSPSANVTGDKNSFDQARRSNAHKTYVCALQPNVPLSSNKTETNSLSVSASLNAFRNVLGAASARSGNH